METLSIFAETVLGLLVFLGFACVFFVAISLNNGSMAIHYQWDSHFFVASLVSKNTYKNTSCSCCNERNRNGGNSYSIN